MTESKKILFAGFDDEVLFPAIEALLDAGHSVVAGIGVPTKVVKEKAATRRIVFEDAVRHHIPEHIFQAAASCPPPSLPLLRSMRDLESEFMIISDRLSYFPLSARSRKSVYLALLAYWFKRLSENKPDVVIFGSTPHMGWDTVLYGVAKNLGCRTLILERTGMPDRLMYLEDYTIQGKVPEEFMANATEQEIQTNIPKDILDSLGKEDAWVKFSKELNAAAHGNPGWLRRALQHAQIVLKRVLKSDSPAKYLFQPHEYSAMFFNVVPRWRAEWEELKAKKGRVDLYRSYDRFSKNVPTDAKYIYFPMHYQPERTTMPLAADYSEHHLAAATIAHALPAGFTLVLKEHPRQFDNIRLAIRTQHFRDESDYRRLSALPNTILAPRGADPAALVANASAVVTLTGTSGWDALKFGVPTVSFGKPWYSQCIDCIYVFSVESAREALQKCLTRTRLDVRREMFRMVAYLHPQTFNGSNSSRFAQFSDANHSDLSKELARATVTALSRLFAKN